MEVAGGVEPTEKQVNPGKNLLKEEGKENNRADDIVIGPGTGFDGLRGSKRKRFQEFSMVHGGMDWIALHKVS
ncbi:hypothetical protein TWF173_004885 [Orbilia oligospora]|nr:hypothetical protein TWF173_004885 [Orbilia oligospora]